jgi:altered-inheritance-of-mitochondria protein 13
VNHLSDSIASPTVTPERQATLDSRVSAELARLRAEEEDVRQQIEAALERENLDRERDLADAHSDASEEAETGSRKATSSDMLRGDLEEVQRKVQRFQERRQLGDFPDIREKQQVLLECYK